MTAREGSGPPGDQPFAEPGAALDQRVLLDAGDRVDREADPGDARIDQPLDENRDRGTARVDALAVQIGKDSLVSDRLSAVRYPAAKRLDVAHVEIGLVEAGETGLV